MLGIMDLGNMVVESQTLLIIIGIVVVTLLIVVQLPMKSKGKVSKIRIWHVPILETYEIIDYKSKIKTKAKKQGDFESDFVPQVLGRSRTSYLVWDREYSYLTIRGKIYDDKGKSLEKKEKLFIREDVGEWKKPSEMRVVIDLDQDIEEEAYEIFTNDKGKFEFKVKISFERKLSSIHSKPIFARLVFSVRTRRGNQITARVICDFHIGPQLGEMWIGIDPGTTATCIAATNAGAEEPHIFMGNSLGKDSINPSRIVFDKESNEFKRIDEIYEWVEEISNGKMSENRHKRNTSTDDEVDEVKRDLLLRRIHEVNRDAIDKDSTKPMYETGRPAGSLFGEEKGISFQSIKKLLGYKDKKIISYGEGQFLELSGKELASLMVKNFYSEFKEFLSANSGKLSDPDEAPFNPQRAIVAIPNTFVASQIQDMVDSIKTIKDEYGKPQFAEVKTINEAEAVMVYCMRHRFNDMEEGTVMIFDMGGATINASLIHQSKKTDQFNLEVLNKIGYAVGGDSIDWCLAKLLFSFKDRYPELNRVNPFKPTMGMDEKERKAQLDLRISLREKVLFPWKKIIVENFKKGSKDLLGNADKGIEDNFIRIILGEESTKAIDEKYDQMEDSFLKEFYNQFKFNPQTSSYPAFDTEFFQHYIYNSAYTAILELLEDNGRDIDYVVFSGRSTEFPLIKAKVLEALKFKGYGTTKIIELKSEEAKIAVAKGACIYGWYNTRIFLDSSKVFHSYGVTYSKGISKVKKEYFELIPMEKRFRKGKPEMGLYARGRKVVSEGLNFGSEIGKMIRFYRVSGKNPQDIVGKEEMKHRYSCVGKIKATQLVEELAIHVDERDIIQCRVKFLDGTTETRQQQLNQESLVNEHEEHYTWLVQ